MGSVCVRLDKMKWNMKNVHQMVGLNKNLTADLLRELRDNPTASLYPHPSTE